MHVILYLNDPHVFLPLEQVYVFNALLNTGISMLKNVKFGGNGFLHMIIPLNTDIGTSLTFIVS